MLYCVPFLFIWFLPVVSIFSETVCVCPPPPPLPYSALHFLVTAFSCFPSIASRLQYSANSAMETRRQRERQKSSKLKKPNNNSAHVSHSLVHFFANSAGQRTKFLDGKLYGGKKTDHDDFSFSSFQTWVRPPRFQLNEKSLLHLTL